MTVLFLEGSMFKLTNNQMAAAGFLKTGYLFCVFFFFSPDLHEIDKAEVWQAKIIFSSV